MDTENKYPISRVRRLGAIWTDTAWAEQAPPLQLGKTDTTPPTNGRRYSRQTDGHGKQIPHFTGAAVGRHLDGYRMGGASPAPTTGYYQSGAASPQYEQNA